MFDITQDINQPVERQPGQLRRRKNRCRSRLALLAAMALLMGFAAACSGGTDTEQISTGTQSDDIETGEAEVADPSASLPSDIPPREQLDMAFDLWAKNGPDSYDLIVELVCEPCGPSKWRHTVIDGNVAMYESLTTTPGYDEGPQTMQDLFTALRGMMMNPDLPSGLELDFDASTGALRSWNLPSEENGARGLLVKLETASDVPVNDHGAAVAEQTCPNVEWQSVQGSAFSLLIPDDLTEVEVEGVDSEVAVFKSATMEVTWDYGGYSNRLDYFESDFTRTNVSYSGIGGHWVSVEPGTQEYNSRRSVAIHFSRVLEEYGDWNGLTVYVWFDDPALQPVAECVVSSLEWN